MRAGYFSHYVWCKGVEQRRHVRICQLEHCGCDEYDRKMEEVAARAESDVLTKLDAQIEGGWRWDAMRLFKR